MLSESLPGSWIDFNAKCLPIVDFYFFQTSTPEIMLIVGKHGLLKLNAKRHDLKLNKSNLKKSYALDPRGRKLGLSFSPAGKASFWLWAPNAQQVTLNLGSHALPLSAADGGYWYKEDFAIDRGDTYTVELHIFF